MRRIVLLAAILSLLMASGAAAPVQLSSAHTYLPGHIAVDLTNDGDACIASSLTFDVRVQFHLEVERPADGRIIHEKLNVSTRLDRPLCPSDTRTISIPVPYEKGTIRTVSIVRTEPRSENVAGVIAEVSDKRSFSNGPGARALAAVGVARIWIGFLSAALIALAWRSGRSRTDRAVLFVAVLLVIFIARWHILTANRTTGTDPAYHLNESRVVVATGDYPQSGERYRPGYMPGFHYLTSVVMLLTGYRKGVLLITALMVPALVALVRRLSLPPLTAPFALLLAGTHTYNIAMTANHLPTAMSLPLVWAALAIALSTSTALARGAALTLIALSLALSHSAGILYLALLLGCAGIYLAYTDPEPLFPMGVALLLASGICLIASSADPLYYHLTFVAGLALVGLSQLRRATSRRFPGGIVYLGAALLVLTLNLGFRAYWGSRSLGGAALGLLAIPCIVLLRKGETAIELPFLLALPHALWSFAGIPLVDVDLQLDFRMRLFLVSLLGIALLGGRSLAAILEHAKREGSLQRMVLLLVATALLGGHLDRLTTLGVDINRTWVPADYVFARAPDDDLRQALIFIESRGDEDIIIYEVPDPLLGLTDKRVLLRGRPIPLLESPAIDGLCSSDRAPLVVIDRHQFIHIPKGTGRLITDLESACYTRAFENPTFSVFARGP